MLKVKEKRKGIEKIIEKVCIYIYIDDKVGGLKSTKNKKEKAKLTQWIAFLYSSSGGYNIKIEANTTNINNSMI